MITISKSQQIFETLRREILSGKFSDVNRFSSEQQLVRRFHASRTTIRLALSQLKDEGILETRNGSGTYLSATAKRVSGRLGLIVPHIAGGEYSPAICAEIATAVGDAGYTLLFGNASSSDPEERARRAIALTEDYIAQDVAGVFLEPIELVNNPSAITQRITSLLDAHGIPVVLIDRDIVPPPLRSCYDLVGIDNFQVGYRLTQHLIGCGARQICCRTRPGSAPTVMLRVQGARSAILDAGLPWTSANICCSEPDDLSGIARLFSGKRQPDAFLCQNDLTAIALMRNLAAIGKKVPQDVLVAGIGDNRLAAMADPPLTSIRQPYRQIARAAVSALLQRLREPSLPPRQILLETQLVVRKSAR